MALSIIIPAYNEAKTIKRVIEMVQSVNLGNIKKEIVVIDDGSADETREILSKIPGIKLHCHNRNMGKGSAIRTGLQHSTGDIIIIQDADLEYNPQNYTHLLEPIFKGRASVVYGSRFIKKGFKPANKFYYIGNILLSLITAALYFKKITDMETCYKVFTRESINNIELKAKGFEFEPEITSKLLKRGYGIIEIPIDYKGRDFKDGKKLRPIREGIKAVYYLLKYRFFD
jgi:glycosyltransferase involved in cell wall biosynthesis